MPRFAETKYMFFGKLITIILSQAQATFESLLKAYGLIDPRLVYIGRIVHDVEINVWERKMMKETVAVEMKINEFILHGDRDETVAKSIRLFDELYGNIP